MRALDLGYVEKARGVADDRATGEDQLRDRLETALVQGSRAVGDPPSADEMLADEGFGLESLQFIERRKVRIPVVQPDHESDCNLVVLQMVKERAAIGADIERPADGMDDEAGPMTPRLDLPQLLDADRVSL